MIQVYNNPWMTDFLSVCIRMPEDERKQLEAFTGEEYNSDNAAVGNFTVPGPKWVVKDAEMSPIAVGGFVPQRPGVYRDFLLSTPEAWGANWFGLTRICRRMMAAMLENGAHRLECIVPLARVAARPELERWYDSVGYRSEGILWRYLADGTDAKIYSRVKH